LDSNGSFEWVQHFRSNGDVVGKSLNLINQKQLVFSGTFEQTADFDPSNNVINKTSSGNRDVFILKLDLCESNIDSIKLKGRSSISSPSGKFIWSSTGIYLDTLTTILGCDSIIYAEVIIDSTSHTAINEHACFSYQSPSGK